jgi:predicted permease
MRNLPGDVLYAIRQFRHAPVFTLTAVLTLALGIGGTTAIFSLMHDVMLRSLPVADPGHLYRIGSGNDCCVEGGPQDNWGLYSYPLFRKLRDAAPEFAEVTAFQASPNRYSVLRPGIDTAARPLSGEFVTGNYFSVFGLRPFAGRLLSPADDSPSAPPAAVLSHRAWQKEWGGEASAIGSSAIIHGQAFTIVGVAPPGFFGDTLRSDPPDFWIPLETEPLLSGHDSLLRQSMSAWLRAIGRLEPGARIEGMSPRLTALLRHWMENESGYPAAWMNEIRRVIPKQNIQIVAAGNGVEEMRENYGRSLQILLAVCGLVLLIACANVANLMIARGMARGAQVSIRIAIGASGRRLIAQSLVESVLLAVMGGLAGLAVAYGAESLIVALAFHQATYLPFSTTPSLPVLAFAFALSLATGIVFGAGPAWLVTRRDPAEMLRGARRTTGDHSSFSRKALLILQATLSVVLVAGAAMLTRSLSNLERQDFGFRSDGLVAVHLNALPPAYSQERLDAVYRSLDDRLRRVPGIERAGMALYAPLTNNWGELIFVDGRPPAASLENSGSSWNRVSAGYFETVGQPILRGRGFTQADTRATETVAVVNEAFVRRFFPNQDPLDHRFGIDLPVYARTFRIVGIARDARYNQVTKPPRPMFFACLTQSVKYSEELLQMVDSRSHFIEAVMLRTHIPPGTLEPIIGKAFAEVDPNLTVVGLRTMNQQISLVFDQQRAVARLAGLFGIVALILAAVGLYGVTAYAVVQRTSEIGIRMALGADKSGVLGLVLRGAFRTVAIGLAIGIPLAIGAGRLIAAQLFGVQGWDPLSLSVAVAALAVCGFAAAIIPALRAATIDPVNALRSE